MARSLPNRLTLALAAGAAGSALAAAPALATEGPAAPAPAPSLPSGIAPPSFLAPSAPSVLKASGVIQRVRVSPRRVKRGQRARLRVSLASPSRLQIVLSRTKGRKRVRTVSLTLPARGNSVSVRLPKRAHGHLLRPDSYRIAVRAIDASGTKSAPVRTSLTVRRARG